MNWHFPLPRTHTGILLGNGTQGLMVWGDKRLHVTVGRAGFWDRRGGTDFVTRVNFQKLRSLLEANDQAGIREAFTPSESPIQVGCGRLEIAFSNGFGPVHAELDIHTATLIVHLANKSGATATATIRQAMGHEIAWIDCDQIDSVVTVPTWDFVGKELTARGCVPPETWETDHSGGFCQRLPADDPLALAWQRVDSRLVVGTALGADASARAQELSRNPNIEELTVSTDAWWKNYWNDVPKLQLPDSALQHTWEYGVYKQAGLTTPGSPAGTLQGPWLEEYQIPPWSSDYHFNINVQMTYWPALGTNRLGHFEPLWDMLRSWLPHLRENAGKFFGVPDALMLPHAVDDRCHVVGSFWTGSVDHACTAWVAQMAWLHYRYSMDEKILRELAWPMLNGAFKGYMAMLEEVETEGGKRLSLPVSVSPEFGAATMKAWGRNASFQLAACHFLARTLPVAAQILGEKEDADWERVRRLLPEYTVASPERGIALWEGRDFDESHRHHSHLASIYPFCTIDPDNAEYREIVRRSMANWASLGAGKWTGWCVPWASILCSRCGLADAAVGWLGWWKTVFTNVGHGTLHDSDFTGAGGLNDGSYVREPKATAFREIMQTEAGMGAVTAILELLVQCRGDVIAVLPQIPARWRELKFDGIRTEGAFLVGATVEAGRAVEVRVKSLAGAPLQLAHGLGEGVTIDGVRRDGAILSIKTIPGQEVVLRRDDHMPINHE